MTNIFLFLRYVTHFSLIIRHINRIYRRTYGHIMYATVEENESYSDNFVVLVSRDDKFAKYSVHQQQYSTTLMTRRHLMSRRALMKLIIHQ